jgi:hypothetical protein
MPAINPREPMTKKARAAIHKYTDHNAEKAGRIGFFMIELVLKAERMKRVDLYAALDKYGYTWDSRRGYWREKKK